MRLNPKPAKKRPVKKIRQPSELEFKFSALWALLGRNSAGEPVKEHFFCTGRRWRFDFAWVSEKVAVEIEGGTWSGGRHTRGSGFIKDTEKYNRATEMGWAVLRYTGDDLKKRPAQVIEQVKACLANRS